MVSRSNKVCRLAHVDSWARLIQMLDTLIVWTEPVTSVDMALSFQEAEGCIAIWFVFHGSFVARDNVNVPSQDFREQHSAAASSIRWAR